jgi:hypothetical protein
MTILNKQYRLFKTKVKGRDIYSIKICLINEENGKVEGYDSNSSITGVSPEHLLDLLRTMPERVNGHRVIDEEKLKQHLNIPQEPKALPAAGPVASPVFTHKDVSKFLPENKQDEIILDMYHLALNAIQDISRLRKTKNSADLIESIYQSIHEELLYYVLDYDGMGTPIDDDK